jgi:hypothetical protein
MFTVAVVAKFETLPDADSQFRIASHVGTQSSNSSRIAPCGLRTELDQRVSASLSRSPANKTEMRCCQPAAPK